MRIEPLKLRMRESGLARHVLLALSVLAAGLRRLEDVRRRDGAPGSGGSGVTVCARFSTEPRPVVLRAAYDGGLGGRGGARVDRSVAGLPVRSRGKT